LILYCGGPAKLRPTALFARAPALPRPGHNLGLGRESGPPLLPAKAESGLEHFWPSMAIGRSSAEIG
jgi:hypothetical protein